MFYGRGRKQYDKTNRYYGKKYNWRNYQIIPNKTATWKTGIRKQQIQKLRNLGTRQKETGTQLKELQTKTKADGYK